MRTELFDYQLPPELIAQTPLPRGQSRLLVLHRDTGKIEHKGFPDLLEYLHSEDTLVLNDTRVLARRLEAVRDSGRSAEVMLLRPVGDRGWESLVKPGKSLRPGKQIQLIGPAPERRRLLVQVVGTTEEGGRLLEFEDRFSRDLVASWGVAPLPPYIHTPLAPDEEERYQTVYGTQEGSAAAPTAGLHFTTEILEQIAARHIRAARLTLHVGIGTFRPVRTEEIGAHQMHAETLTISEEAATIVNQTRGRVIAVGTTSARALETAAGRTAVVEKAGTCTEEDIGREGRVSSPRVVAYTGETRIFISPGYQFRVVDALITNFHLPRSTLLMMVSALAGREQVLAAYQEAIKYKYRFFSFGDAMLII